MPVARDIFSQVVSGQENTFETQYFNGVIDGKGINSFKIIGVIPFSKKAVEPVKKDSTEK